MKNSYDAAEAERLRQQAIAILRRNADLDFLRAALTKVAVLEQVWHELHQAAR